MNLSQEDQPETHSTPVGITRELNVECQSVSRIIDQDLDLRLLRKHKGQNLLIRTLKSAWSVQEINDNVYSENITNCILSWQNFILGQTALYLTGDVVYVPKKMKVEVPKVRLLFKIKAFPKQEMGSVAESKTGQTFLIFCCWTDYEGKCEILL